MDYIMKIPFKIKFLKKRDQELLVPSTPLRIHEDPVVQSFIRRHMASPQTFVSRIDEEDEMFLFALKAHNGDRRRTAIGYYTLGASIFGAIRQIAMWHFGGLENVASFLDFACGYGRSTRFLSQALSPSRIWACDIYSDAVDFQKRNYGVNGIASVPDPERFPKDKKFDYIFASSFFTHIPQETFGTWIRTLYELLNPRGILAFSTHDFSLIPPSIMPPVTGILFSMSSESRTLPKSQYGTTYVNERFVTEVVEDVTAGKGKLYRVERGLCYFQDIYILANSLNREFSEFTFFHDPIGYVDLWKETSKGVIDLAGWAADFNPGGSIKEVTFSSGDRIIDTIVVDHDRDDVAEYFKCPSAVRSGWRYRISRDNIHSDEVFEVSATNHVGKNTVIVYNFPDALTTHYYIG